MSKEYKYPKVWFRNNLIPVPVKNRVGGNCSACVFRSTLYCENMSCTYLDEQSDTLISVYWRSNKTYENISLWTEFRKWFESMTPERVLAISNEVIETAITKELEKTR